MAAFFHTFHNAVSQVLVPRALGAGNELLLGESGIFPVIGYLIAGLLVLVALRRDGQTSADFARKVLGSAAVVVSNAR